MHRNQSSKTESLTAWRLAVRNFIPKEEKFFVGKIQVRLVRFDHKMCSLDEMSEMLVDDPHVARGIIWINSGLDRPVPCIIYDASQMFNPDVPPSSLMSNIWSPSNLLNAIGQAVADAQFAGTESVAIFESKYNPDLIGWMVEPIDVLQVVKDEGWKPKGEPDKW